MTNDEIVNYIVHRIMYEHEECPEDTAMRFFIEHVCGFASHKSYSEQLLHQRLTEAFKKDFI